MSVPPVINRRILEALLENRLSGAQQLGRRLVLVHGRYDPAAPVEFTARIGPGRLRVAVSDQASVLGVIDAWQTHRASTGPEAPEVLVVTTGVDDHALGVDLRGHALERRVLTVDHAEIVKQRFGAADLDPRIRREGWLVDALLAAEPVSGWRDAAASTEWRRSGGTVLTLDAAVRALLEARLFPSGDRAELAAPQSLDTDALLAWSRTPVGPARFAELRRAERDGLIEWVRATVGDAGAVVLTLAANGHGADAMALGVVAGVLAGPSDVTGPGDAAGPAGSADAALAVGGLFAGVSIRPDELRAFTGSDYGTLTRWIGEAESERSGHDAARARVMAVLDRADELVEVAGLGSAMAGDPYLPTGLRSRLRALADALRVSPEAAEAALRRLTDHRIAGLFEDRCEVARMAVRLCRWLATSVEVPASVAAGVAGQVSSWGWADRAQAALLAGDPGADPVVGLAYQEVHRAVADRRAELDRGFGARVAVWAGGAGAQTPGGCLLVEELLDQVAVPLARIRTPLVVVLDGMSGAVAAELGEQLARRGWAEATAAPGARRAAVAMMPSTTTTSRASLLCGRPVKGGQATETAGFRAFWARHRHEAVLFHKSDLSGAAGYRLAQPLLDALAGDHVVGVVLNTIDDALDHGREGSRTGWRLSDITHLPELLDAARGAGRPVVVTSDHGHLPDRGEPAVGTSGVQAARWRIGTAADGEIEVSGPRVLEGDGRVVMAVRDDIHYTPRKAGYHGGASLAEMTVPVLALLPGPALLPPGWTMLATEQAEPPWWAGREPIRPAPPSAAPARRVAIQRQDEALFAVESPAPSFGRRVVAAVAYAEQKRYVRKPPENAHVAAVIDALVAAGGTLSPTALGAAATAAGGRAPRDPDLFVTTLQRLLNVEGYLVLGLIDSGRTVKLDLPLLREQFGVAS